MLRLSILLSLLLSSVMLLSLLLKRTAAAFSHRGTLLLRDFEVEEVVGVTCTFSIVTVEWSGVVGDVVGFDRE